MAVGFSVAAGSPPLADLYDEETRSVPYRSGDEYARAKSAAKTISDLNTTILPQARWSAQSSRAAYENGTAGFLDVLTSYMTVFEAEMTYQHEVERLFVAAARLEELTGVDPAR